MTIYSLSCSGIKLYVLVDLALLHAHQKAWARSHLSSFCITQSMVDWIKYLFNFIMHILTVQRRCFHCAKKQYVVRSTYQLISVRLFEKSYKEVMVVCSTWIFITHYQLLLILLRILWDLSCLKPSPKAAFLINIGQLYTIWADSVKLFKLLLQMWWV